MKIEQLPSDSVHEDEERPTLPGPNITDHFTVPVGLYPPVTVAVHASSPPTEMPPEEHDIEIPVPALRIVTLDVPELGLLPESPP